MHRPTRTEAGFTLLELIAVVVAIIILALLLYFIYTNSQNQMV